MDRARAFGRRTAGALKGAAGALKSTAGAPRRALAARKQAKNNKSKSEAANRSRARKYDNNEIKQLSNKINAVNNQYKTDSSYTKNQAIKALNNIHKEIDNLVENFAQEIAINFKNQSGEYTINKLATRGGNNPISNWNAIRKKLIGARELNNNLNTVRMRIKGGEKPTNNGSTGMKFRGAVRAVQAATPRSNNANRTAVRNGLRGRNMAPATRNGLVSAIMNLPNATQNQRVRVAKKIANRGTNGNAFNLNNGSLNRVVANALAAVKRENNNARAVGAMETPLPLFNNSTNPANLGLGNNNNNNNTTLNELRKLVNNANNKGNLNTNAVLKYIANARENNKRASIYKLNTNEARRATVTRAIANMKKSKNRKNKTTNNTNNVLNLNTALGGFGANNNGPNNSLNERQA